MKTLLKMIIASIVGLMLVVAITVSALTLYRWENVWERISGNPDLGPITFLTLQKTSKPNQALVCPTGYCVSAKIDLESPTYALSAQELKRRFVNAIESEEQVRRVDDTKDALKLRYVQRTKWLKFPDTIRIEFIAIDAERSTLAIYSQSQIGTSDLGVNLERVKRWLKYLQTFERQSA